MKDFEIWQLSHQKLLGGKPVVLMVVVDHEGSSPGKQGFKMVITANGEQFGSIGGGVMELNLIEESKNMLAKKSFETKFKVQKHHKQAPGEEQSGLICSGVQYVVLQPLYSKEHLELLEFIIGGYGTKNHGVITMTKEGIVLEKNTKQSEDHKFINLEEWIYKENVADPFTAHIFGGGHVGGAIARTLSLLDFYVILYDNRKDLEMMEDNPHPHRKIVGPYSKIANEVNEGEKSMVVIATFGMPHDAEVLEQVITKDLGYVGLMGSDTKIRHIFTRMWEIGISRELTDKVYAPIGIDINDETAEEIAISVAAQLIKVKNEIRRLSKITTSVPE